MIVILTGAPGAGKGTQADLLAQRCGFKKISTGDALRKHVKEGSEIGKVADAIMKRGELVPDDVLFKVLKEEIGDSRPGQVVLLDGYPRNVSQADTLDTLGDAHPVKAVIQLDVATEELVTRLSGRRVCGACGATFHVHDNPPRRDGLCDRCGEALLQRPDDRPESVRVRLDVYEKNTRPILDFYERRGLVRQVRGVGKLEGIYSELKGVIDTLV